MHVALTFLTPALPESLDILAAPLTYLTWVMRSVTASRTLFDL